MGSTPVTDPRGGGPNPPGGRQHTILPNFPKNCMQLKEFGPQGGGARPLRPPLDPPLDGMHAISTHQVIRLFAGGIYTFLSDDGDRAGVFANEVRHV